MREGWRTVLVEDVAQVVNGGTPKTNVTEYWNGGHLWITPAEMGRLGSPFIASTRRSLTNAGLQNSSATLVPAKSIILSTRAPIGYLVINAEPMAFNQGCRGLVPHKHVHYKYLYYFLYSSVDLLNDLGVGTTFKELAAGKLKKVEIPLPPLPEQRHIVAILDEAFAGIATAVANTETNLANARELFESYLNGVIEGAYENGDVTVLSDLAAEITDGDHMPPPKTPSGIPFVTIKNIDKRTRRVDFENTFSVSREYFERLKANKRPKEGDVLYTVTGSFGIPVLVDQEKEFCFQRHIGLIRPLSGTDSRWLYYLLMSPQLSAQAVERATGTAQKTVSLKVLRSFRVPVIKWNQQLDAVKRLDEIFSDTQRLESIYQQKLTALAELKQSLLQKAFSGELTADKPAAGHLLKEKEVA